MCAVTFATGGLGLYVGVADVALGLAPSVFLSVDVLLQLSSVQQAKID